MPLFNNRSHATALTCLTALAILGCTQDVAPDTRTRTGTRTTNRTGDVDEYQVIPGAVDDDCSNGCVGQTIPFPRECTDPEPDPEPKPETGDLLPDITVDPADLEDNVIQCLQMQDTKIRALRLSVGTPNIGEGPLQLNQLEISAGGTVQTIYRDDGTTITVPVGGEMGHHELHDHIHYDNWTQMRVIDNDPACLDIATRDTSCVLSESEKVTFCIMDTDKFDQDIIAEWAQRDLVPFSRGMFTDGGRVCNSTEQGLTPGWKDVYFYGLPGQWIDITGMPAGEYTIEVQVDPNGQVVESNTDNNVARLPITIDADTCDWDVDCTQGDDGSCDEFYDYLNGTD
jgi:hypothetical protein